MKNIYKKIYNINTLIFLCSLVLGFFYTITFAKVEKIEYTLLEPGVFTGSASSSAANTTDLISYIGSMFDLLIAVAVVLAVVMIIIGGFEYMTTDAWGKKDDGKKKIKDAFWGLALALAAYLILYTINPCLVQFTGSNGCEQVNKLLEVK